MEKEVARSSVPCGPAGGRRRLSPGHLLPLPAVPVSQERGQRPGRALRRGKRPSRRCFYFCKALVAQGANGRRGGKPRRERPASHEAPGPGAEPPPPRDSLIAAQPQHPLHAAVVRPAALSRLFPFPPAAGFGFFFFVPPVPRGSGRGRLPSGEPEGGRAAGGPAPRQDGGRRPRGRPGRGGRRAVAGAAGRGAALLPLGPGGGAQGECRSPSGPPAARCLGDQSWTGGRRPPVRRGAGRRRPGLPQGEPAAAGDALPVSPWVGGWWGARPGFCTPCAPRLS